MKPAEHLVMSCRFLRFQMKMKLLKDAVTTLLLTSGWKAAQYTSSECPNTSTSGVSSTSHRSHRCVPAMNWSLPGRQSSARICGGDRLVE